MERKKVITGNMERKKFTVSKIEELLNLIGFEWVDKIIYIPQKNRYERAKSQHFKGLPTFLYVKNIKNNCTVLASTVITNEEFVIGFERSEMDASNLWKDVLNNVKLDV